MLGADVVMTQAAASSAAAERNRAHRSRNSFSGMSGEDDTASNLTFIRPDGQTTFVAADQGCPAERPSSPAIIHEQRRRMCARPIRLFVEVKYTAN